MRKIKKERFEFVVRISDNIICQRFFKIRDYAPESRKSICVQNALRGCAELIKRDLVMKTQLYLSYASPLIVHNLDSIHYELLEFGDWLYCKEDGISYVWDDRKCIPAEIHENISELISPIEQKGRIIYFTFIDNNIPDRAVFTQCWNMNVYPKLIRERVDITNKRPTYDFMKDNRADLVPQIIKIISNTCSNKGHSNKTK